MTGRVEHVNTAIIGGGPGGLMTAHTLAQLSPSDQTVLFEVGQQKRPVCPVLVHQKDCHGCNGQCHIIHGGGGACSNVSCGLLSKYPAGSGMTDFVPVTEIQRIEDDVISWMTRIHGRPLNLVEPNISSDTLVRLQAEGLTSKAYPSFEVKGAEFDALIQQVIGDIALNENVNMQFETTVTDIKSDPYGGYTVTAKSRQGLQHFHADNVVFATGRAGKQHGSFELWDKVGVEVGGIYGYQGIRIEGPVRPELLKLREQVADPKFLDGNGFRIFCFCAKGQVVGMRMSKHELSEHSFLDTLEGCVRDESDFGNFSIQQATEFKNLPAYRAFMQELLARYQAISSLRLVGQSFNSLVHDTKPERFPSSIHQRVHPGRIKDFMDPKLVDEAIEFLFKLDRAFRGGIITPDTGVHAPELHFWPEVKLGNGFESQTASGVYVVGDIGGVARGIMQAMVGGAIAAQHIANK